MYESRSTPFFTYRSFQPPELSSHSPRCWFCCSVASLDNPRWARARFLEGDWMVTLSGPATFLQPGRMTLSPFNLPGKLRTFSYQLFHSSSASSAPYAHQRVLSPLCRKYSTQHHDKKGTEHGSWLSQSQGGTRRRSCHRRSGNNRRCLRARYRGDASARQSSRHYLRGSLPARPLPSTARDSVPTHTMTAIPASITRTPKPPARARRRSVVAQGRSGTSGIDRAHGRHDVRDGRC
jgi:hypothetical protein